MLAVAAVSYGAGRYEFLQEQEYRFSTAIPNLLIQDHFQSIVVFVGKHEKCGKVLLRSGMEGIYLNLYLSARVFEISAGLVPHKAELRTYRLKVPRLQMKAFLSAGFLFVYRIRQKQFLLGTKRSIFVEKDITFYESFGASDVSNIFVWSFEKPLKKRQYNFRKFGNDILKYHQMMSWKTMVTCALKTHYPINL